ncbi:hypothetical protein [Amycolatopsis sp. NPDC051128]|uniref:hypothetical protein n=1 Tax=Amycolatopsis sp. NPDC051128 TaxID=3155412 RepID=UPI0034295CCC
MSDSWYTEKLQSTLRLDLDVPTLTEERTIVAVAHELDEIVIAFSGSRTTDADPSRSIAAQMVYGGEIVDERRISRSHAEFIVRLPEPLAMGERHTYQVAVENSGPQETMKPFYVLTPRGVCASFGARVKFPVGAYPKQVWRIDGLVAAAVNDLEPQSESIAINNVGEAYAEFHSLELGRSYGIGWS